MRELRKVTAWLLLVIMVLPCPAMSQDAAKSAEAAKPFTPEQAPPAAQRDAPAESKASADAAKRAVIPPKRFASAEQAVQNMVTAMRAGDTKAVRAVLGSESAALVSSGDPVADQIARELFLKAYDASHKLAVTGNRAVLILQVGGDDWPFPVPIVNDGPHWRFDPRLGRAEIVARRIGRNELYAIQTCLAYVDAQREYYSEDRNGDGILEYARQFASTSGMRNGLYWDTNPGERPSPLGQLVVRAHGEGYRRDKSGGPTPFHGYLYRILTAQGAAAPGGPLDYVVNGAMIAGFALVAFPAEYGVSGVMTFIVNHDAVVYEKNLGPGTRGIATAMQAYNPDQVWAKVTLSELALSPNSPRESR